MEKTRARMSMTSCKPNKGLGGEIKRLGESEKEKDL